MAGRAEGTVKQLIGEKRNVETLLWATIGMMVARGTCDLEEILKLHDFTKEQVPESKSELEKIKSQMDLDRLETKMINAGIKSMQCTIDKIEKQLIPKKEDIVQEKDIIREEGTAEGEIGPKAAKEKIDAEPLIVSEGEKVDD